MQNIIRNTLQEAERTISQVLTNTIMLQQIEAMAKQMAAVLLQRGKLIAFGNGGSMCDAIHFAEELSGRFNKDREALPAIALSDPGYLSCVANDYGWDNVFARGVEAFALKGDLVLGISTSGNSSNIINALETAKRKECFTASLLGKEGGKLKGSCDYEIIVPSDNTARIQEIHGIIIHLLIELIEYELFTNPKENPQSKLCC
ncbi:MAG TPA: SIS domain-containing protein [Candidatus Cloacimonas sp.]|nr:SIS domain-containing protein [Candidatus Cloacimonas sp.]HPS59813.1 SIS domain-containing protein [Candidatus Cloacimonas sp.]